MSGKVGYGKHIFCAGNRGSWLADCCTPNHNNSADNLYTFLSAGTIFGKRPCQEVKY